MNKKTLEERIQNNIELRQYIKRQLEDIKKQNKLLNYQNNKELLKRRSNLYQLNKLAKEELKNLVDEYFTLEEYK